MDFFSEFEFKRFRGFGVSVNLLKYFWFGGYFDSSNFDVFYFQIINLVKERFDIEVLGEIYEFYHHNDSSEHVLK